MPCAKAEAKRRHAAGHIIGNVGGLGSDRADCHVDEGGDVGLRLLAAQGNSLELADCLHDPRAVDGAGGSSVRAAGQGVQARMQSNLLSPHSFLVSVPLFVPAMPLASLPRSPSFMLHIPQLVWLLVGPCLGSWPIRAASAQRTCAAWTNTLPEPPRGSWTGPSTPHGGAGKGFSISISFLMTAAWRWPAQRFLRHP